MKNDLLPTIVNIPDDIGILYNYYKAYEALFDDTIEFIKIGYHDKCQQENYYLIYTNQYKEGIELNVIPIYMYYENEIEDTISEESHTISIKEIDCINDYTKSNLSFKFYPKIEEALKPHLTKIRMME